MNKKKNEDLLKFVAAIFVTGTLMLVGCGGGSNGLGDRQVLPGENPYNPIIVPGTGTGTSTTTDTKTDTGTDTGTDILTPAQSLIKGWEETGNGNFGGSIAYFTNVLNDSRTLPDQRQQALNGRGWARANYYDTIQGLDDFKSAYQLGELNPPAYKEATLGYALALIQASGEVNYDRAIQLLGIELKLADPYYALPIEHTSIGVTSPEAHAMLAFAYYWRSNATLAVEQIKEARVADPSLTGTVNQVYETLRSAGLL